MDARTNNNRATRDRGAGDGIEPVECSEGALLGCATLAMLVEVVRFCGVLRLYGWVKLLLEIGDGEPMPATAVPGNEVKTKLRDPQLITTSNTPSQSGVLVV